jgi:hypothetical protein
MKKYLAILVCAIFGMASYAQADTQVSGGGSSGLSACSDADYTTGTKTDCAGTPANAKVELDKKAAVNASTTGSAGSVKSNATTGIMQITGPAAGSTRVVTIPDANVTIPAAPVGSSGTKTEGMQTCWDANGLAISCGVPIYSNAATSGGPYLLGLDNANPAEQKEVTLDGHLSLTGTSAPALAVVTPQVIYHAAADTAPTAAQMTGPGVKVNNYDQGAEDVFVPLPTAAADLSGLYEVVTAQAGNHWGACTNAAVADKIYLIAADGTIAAGDDDACVVMTAAQLGQTFACWTFKSGASSFDWKCKAIAIGTSTFAAHATP